MFDQIRSACARVARRARHIRLTGDPEAYARALPLAALNPVYDSEHHYQGPPETLVAYLLTLNTVNFGSGYFPQLQKRADMSGYFTVASRLKDHFEKHGAIRAEKLAQLTPQRVAQMFHQELNDEVRVELMVLFTQALSDLGNFLLEHYHGSFTALIEAAGSRAEKLVELLLTMPYFRDIAHYDGEDVPFLKRAQITVSDLALAFENEGYGHFEDLDELTIFADNLVPHVLRMDGLHSYDDHLATLIKEGTLIEPGSPEEVEIRAAALNTVELMVATLRRDGHKVSARQLDILLWNKGQKASYKIAPRHRSRTVYY